MSSLIFPMMSGVFFGPTYVRHWACDRARSLRLALAGPAALALESKQLADLLFAAVPDLQRLEPCIKTALLFI
jgi:hypothetical protein